MGGGVRRVEYVFSTYSVRIQYAFSTHSVRIHNDGVRVEWWKGCLNRHIRADYAD